jgi:D-arabinose 1-dehydrogenase-like Zn-dependent alcohol dehydrogenase
VIVTLIDVTINNIIYSDMLEFCAKHGIVAQTESLEMTPSNANAALAKVEANTARYASVALLISIHH